MAFNTASTTTRPSARSERESLANFISNISRDETPFMSSIGKTSAKAIIHEWSTDTLSTPFINQNGEGSGYTDTGGDLIQRLSNKTQIFTKGISVSGTLETVDKAGRKSEFAYQTQKRGQEIMRDIEFSLVSTRQVDGANAATLNAGFAGTPFTDSQRALGGYQSWAPAGNVVNSDGTSAPVASTAGDGTGKGTATVGGTAAAFALVDIDAVMRQVYENGGMPTTLMLSPSKKVQFSNFANGADNVRRNIDFTGGLRQGVETYESDFGVLKVMVNYVMGTAVAGATHDTDVLVYDPKMFNMATLRPLHHRDIREEGDAKRAYLVHECTLECVNPNSVGLIANITSA